MFGFGTRRAAPTVPRTIEVAGRSVPLEVTRNPRARRITLRADAVRGVVRLTLPQRARIGDAIDFLAAHEAWLRPRVAAWPAPLPFVDGATIPFDGGTLTLAWCTGTRGVVRDGDLLVVGGDVAALPGRVTRWLKAQAIAELTHATHALAAAHGLSVAAVGVRDPAARWGSCSSSTRIAYSWRLVLTPPAVRASVVAPEVAHLVHPNHAPAFWAYAAHLGGDPTPHRRWLARHGAGLHWVGRVGAVD